MRRALFVGFVLIALAASGCKTAVGNYFGNRARDLGDCFRVEAGAALGVGAGVRAAGIADVGLGGGTHWRTLSVGWVYGTPLPELKPDSWGRHMELWFPVTTVQLFASIGDSPHVGPPPWLLLALPFAHMEGPLDADGHIGSPPFESHTCLSLFPMIGPLARAAALESEVEIEIERRARRQAIHAFDVEASVYAGVLYARAGFSIGEFADFVLGFFGLDLAGDDAAWPPPEDE